jgi:hypothetical protein
MTHLPLCRDAADETRVCPFSGICHETRQRIAHYAIGGSLRGNACSWYQMLAEKRPDLLPGIVAGDPPKAA